MQILRAADRVDVTTVKKCQKNPDGTLQAAREALIRQAAWLQSALQLSRLIIYLILKLQSIANNGLSGFFRQWQVI